MGKRTVALIVGCNGFTGKYLASFLRKRKKSYKIIGVDIQTERTSDVDIYIKGSQLSSLHKELKGADKVYCFHLAGLIFEKDIDKLLANNLEVTRKIFSFLLPYKDKTTVLNIGSSAEYGYQGERKITERCNASPISDYGFCKLFQTQLAKHYHDVYGLPVVMTRTFNMIGPGQTDKLVCGSLVKQAVQCRMGLEDKIITKGLNAYRDLLDVRDAVRAYVILAEKGIPGELYNIASGRSIKMEKVLGSILTISGASPRTIKKNDFSKKDVSYQKASIGKIKRLAGWKPLYSFEKSIKDMVSFEMDGGR